MRRVALVRWQCRACKKCRAGKREAALGVGIFAEKTLAAAGQCTKVTGVSGASEDQNAAAGLLDRSGMVLVRSRPLR